MFKTFQSIATQKTQKYEEKKSAFKIQSYERINNYYIDWREVTTQPSKR